MLPVLERLLYKPRVTQVTRVLVLVPTRELGIQVHSVARQLGQFTNITTCLAVGMCSHFYSFWFTLKLDLFFKHLKRRNEASHAQLFIFGMVKHRPWLKH